MSFEYYVFIPWCRWSQSIKTNAARSNKNSEGSEIARRLQMNKSDSCAIHRASLAFDGWLDEIGTGPYRP